MTKLSCRDYGFECNFEVEGNDVDSIVTDFGKHTHNEHGIEYSKEVLMQFILSDNSSERGFSNLEI